MFAVIHIPDFFLQAALRPEPELHSHPVSLVEANVPKPVILQLTQAARDAGVREGMAPTQALARCSAILIKTRSVAHESAARQALLDCAFAFSPRVEATSPGICTLDLKGFHDLHYEVLGDKILSSLWKLHLAGQVGVAENPLLALQAARCARPFLLVENSREFLAALPIESIEPSLEVLGILKKWGIHTLGAFTALGREALTERLGPEALTLFERATACTTRPLQHVHPPETFEEAIEFEQAIETAQPLLFVLHRFIEQICLRLEMVYLVIEELQLRLIFSDGPDYKHVFQIPAPTRNIDTLFRMLQTHLETLQTEHPIRGLHLSAKSCRPTQQQLGLFEAALRDPNQFYETLARLTALVGCDRIGTPAVEPTYRPDAFRLQPVNVASMLAERGSTPGDETTRPIQGLCLRRFRPPLQAEVEVKDRRPIAMKSSRFSGGISKANGPWLISGNWWDHHRWDREEWDVQTFDGNLYRLFQQDSDWFLDGVYD
jgi:protein ImuB